jgi:hypothetical protein
MKAGGTTKRPFVLQMDGAYFVNYGVRQLAVVGIPLRGTQPTDSKGEESCSISISFVKRPMLSARR